MRDSSARWEAVRDPYDNRRVVYWRLLRGGRFAGAVSRRDGVYRALAYGPNHYRQSSDRTELGGFATKAAAQRAVEARGNGGPS